MENSNFKKLSNTLVDYFQRIQNEIDFKDNGFYSKYGRSIKIVLNRTNTLRDLFDALVANEVISPEPTQTSWSFEVTDRIQLVGCAFLYLKINEVAPNANYYRIYAVTDGMKVINTAADHMKTIDYIMGYAESLPNKIPTDSDLVHKTEAETISGQKTFTEKTTFAAETNFNANTIFADTAQFNGNLKIKNKTIEAIIDERIETNSGGTETDALLPKTIDLGEIVADQPYPFPTGMTVESFVEIDAVKLTTTIQEMSVSCTLKKSGEVQSVGVMFSAVGMNKLLQFMITPEGMMLLMTETPSSWWVEGIGISNSSINVNRYHGGEYGTDTLYGTNIKLNGTTHSPFHFDEVKTLDLDAAIAKKQDALTVGEGIAIQDNVISATHSKKYMHVARITSSATISDTDNFAFYMNVYIISSSSTAYETIGEYYNELGYRQHVATGEIYMYNERQTITGLRFAYDNEFHVDSAYFTEGEKGKRYFGNSRTIPWSDTYDFTVVDLYEM